MDIGISMTKTKNKEYERVVEWKKKPAYGERLITFGCINLFLYLGIEGQDNFFLALMSFLSGILFVYFINSFGEGKRVYWREI